MYFSIEIFQLYVLFECDLAYEATNTRQRHPQNYDLGATRSQTAGMSKEDVETANQGGHEGGRGLWDMTLDRAEYRRRIRPTPRR